MYRYLMAASAAALMSSHAMAGGLDRTGQPIGIIFEEGNYAEVSLGYTTPSVTGVETMSNPIQTPNFGNSIGNVADSFLVVTGGIKMDFGNDISGALIFDQPYGSDVTYPGNPLATALGGTEAIADSASITALARYKFSDRFSIYGGPRFQQIEGNITLAGFAYGQTPPNGLNGYNVDLGKSRAMGYVVGAAYEIPEIALRVAATYSSEITHKMDTIENINLPGPSADTEIKSPKSVNIDFQTGIAPGTLLFGNVRWAEWSSLIISPEIFDLVTPGEVGTSISELDDSLNVSLGVGRRITDNFSASVSLGWERPGDDDLVSPLSPSNGNKSITIGGRYTMDDVIISGGVRYTMLGDARPETGTPDVERADFSGNSAVSVGVKVGFRF